MALTIHEALKRIAAELEDADGEFVAGIYNQVCETEIQYVGDGMFEPLVPNPPKHFESGG